MKRKMIVKMCVALGLTALLSACGSLYEQEPVGIGRDISELKRSPCACLLLKLPKDLPAWMSANG